MSARQRGLAGAGLRVIMGEDMGDNGLQFRMILAVVSPHIFTFDLIFLSQNTALMP
jgi:hypothetical protein